ncbi:Card1-like endonuclease domain-containing protein [Vibrio sp. WXL210]|uniref:Card1-like endonuclease domain-containing protein n=1 Tax=Vibrio sp. WXL210 TaxID=3450709 RepID=UPI003EC90C87
MAVHINLLSQQLIPNVIPVLSDPKSITKIYLVLAGEQYRQSAAHLEAFYRRKDINNIELFHCNDPNDFYDLKSQAMYLLDKIKTEYNDEMVILNATCGTKPMSLAFTKVFDDPSNDCMAIYTDSIKKRVIILNDEVKLDPLPYNDVLDIKDYFNLNNFIIHKQNNNIKDEIYEREQLTKSIIGYASRNTNAISEINRLCQHSNFSELGNFTPKVKIGYAPRHEFKSILSLAQNRGLLTYDNTSVVFSSADDARYLGGGWLEELIYLAAQEVGIDKVKINVEGHLLYQNKDSNDVKNEFDVVLLHNNQLKILEAKTINWRKQHKQGQVATAKLDSLNKNYGGAFGKATLVTVFPPTQTIKNRSDGIQNLDVTEVKNYDTLKTALADWKKSTL